MRIVALTFIKRSATYMLLWFYKLKSEDDVVNEISILWCGNMAQAIFKGIINSKN